MTSAMRMGQRAVNTHVILVALLVDCKSPRVSKVQ